MDTGRGVTGLRFLKNSTVSRRYWVSLGNCSSNEFECSPISRWFYLRFDWMSSSTALPYPLLLLFKKPLREGFVTSGTVALRVRWSAVLQAVIPTMRTWNEMVDSSSTR
jgi:hypothetical protein